jgi:predicted transcriptional regulator
MSKNQSQGIPGWVKALIAIGAVGAGIYLVYYTVTNIFGAGVNAYKEMFEQQYDALLKKMDTYVKQNGSSGFTPVQQQAIAEEEKILALTEQGLADASNGLYSTLITVTEIMVAGAAAVGISAVIIRAWINKTGQKAYTGHGASYIAARSIADQLATQGNYVQATNLISSLQTMYQTIDLSMMQQTVASLQASLPNLVGVQLLTAQQMITQLNIEVSAIPIWLSMPLPVLPL